MEINKYTDIKVAYDGKKEDLSHRKTRAIRTIEFYMVGKTEPEQQVTDQIIDAEYVQIQNEDDYHQMSIEEMFFKDHEKSLDEEREKRKVFEESANKKRKNKIKHKILFEELNEERNADFDEAKVNCLYSTAIRNRVAGKVPRTEWEMFAVDLVTYYYDKIIATVEDTKTTVYNRLLDCVKNDYDNQVNDIIEQYKK